MLYPDNTVHTESLPSLRKCIDLIRESVGNLSVMHRGPFDPVVTNQNCFIPTRLISGRFSLKPNISTQPVLFRGQVYSKEVAKAKLYCTPPPYIVENIKLNEFKSVLESHPLYQLFKEGIKFPDGDVWVIENPYGLAMSYGLMTRLLSFSSSLEIAAFHAVAEYDAITHKYETVNTANDTTEGVIYVFILNRPFSMFPGLSAIGLQPFPRPGIMREFALDVPRSVNFNQINQIVGFRFKHTQEDVIFFSQKFAGGCQLVNADDELLNKTSEILKSKELMLSAFEQNLRDNPSDIRENNASFIQQKGYQISDTRRVVFTDEELSIYYSNALRRWEEICKSIFFGGKNAEKKREWMSNLPYNIAYRHYFER